MVKLESVERFKQILLQMQRLEWLKSIKWLVVDNLHINIYIFRLQIGVPSQQIKCRQNQIEYYYLHQWRVQVEHTQILSSDESMAFQRSNCISIQRNWSRVHGQSWRDRSGSSIRTVNHICTPCVIL